MKRLLRFRWGAVVASILALLVVLSFGVDYAMDQSVHEIVEAAQLAHEGDSVTALLAIIHDTDLSLREKNRAVWALGRIGDTRALEPLQRLYMGGDCDHAQQLCQHELQKAITLCGILR